MISPLPSLARCAVVALGVLFVVHGLLAQDKPLYKDPKQPVEARVNDLLSRMTLAEKVAQLQSTLRQIEWGKNITEDGLGGIGPVLRSFSAADAARKANEYQKLAQEKTRLGIPILLHDEALHGLIGNGATSFPQSIALAATWDPRLMQRIGTAIGKETRSGGSGRFSRRSSTSPATSAGAGWKRPTARIRTFSRAWRWPTAKRSRRRGC